MKTLCMAAKNLKARASFYALYLISVSLVIAVFFAFSSFSVCEIVLARISEYGRVETMCRSISAFLMAFVLFYMSTSNRFFLRRRTRELGIYALLGYRRSAIAALLACENALIACLAFGVGLCLGAALNRGIVAGVSALLDLGIDGASVPLFDGRAVRGTAGFILLVVAALGISNVRFLMKTSLMELVRFEKAAEKRMRFRPAPAALGLALLLAGYGLAADILRGSASVWYRVGLYPVAGLTTALVVAGTVLLIGASLPYVLNRQKRDRRSFYTPEAIVFIPQLVYRVRSNAKTLIMLTLLQAATLTVSGVLALTLYYPIAAVGRMAPSDIEFRLEEPGQLEAVRRLIEGKMGVSLIRTDLCRVTSTAENLPPEYSLGSAKGDSENEKLLRESGFECMPRAKYAALLAAQGKEEAAAALPALREDECILAKYQPGRDGGDETGSVYPLETGGSPVPVTVRATTLDNAISFANSVATLIVSDELYERLAASAEPVASVVSVNGEAIRGDEALYEAISSLLGGSPYLQSGFHRIHVLFKLNSSTFLLIGFVVALFFIATGSILYFGNVAAVSDAKADYAILMKMGYTRSRIRRVIRRQVTAFFAIPFALGLLDCAFATVVYKEALMQNLLGPSLSQAVPVLLAVCLTAAIDLAYAALTVASCNRVALVP